MCDFSGFEEPEMVKERPVIVLAGPMKGRGALVTVVPLSTVEPPTLMPYHLKMPKQCLPKNGMFQERDSWVKGDMIYTVAFHRLDLIRVGPRDRRTGKRVYYLNVLSRERMRDIYACVLHGMHMGHLVAHI